MTTQKDRQGQVPASGEPQKLDPESMALEWTWLNLIIGATSIGGAGRIQFYREKLVEKERWMTIEEFREAFSIAQLLPGPVLLNCVVYLGSQLANWRVSIIALMFLGFPGAYFAVLISKFVNLDDEWMKWLFQGFAIGGIVAFGHFVWELAKGLTATANPNHVSTKARTLGRAAVAIGVAIASYSGFDLAPIVILGGLTALAVEFRM